MNFPKDKIETYKPDIADLQINKEDILKGFGYQYAVVPDSIISMIEDILHQSVEYLNISCGFRLFTEQAVIINRGKIYSEKFIFEAGKIVTSQFKKVTSLAIFIASLGLKYDLWIKSLFEKGDAAKGYMVDTIGSVIVDATAAWIAETIEKKLEIYALTCTNRFSPGYCEWDVKDQQKLFKLLPENFCEVRLTSSSLMLPIKSISGIIGIGRGVKKGPYPCTFCNMDNCHMRKIDHG